MPYDFDREINRYDSASLKWDEAQTLFGEKDILPMWVADMDFPSPTPVIEAIRRRVEHGVFGYTVRTTSYLDAVAAWMRKRHNWEVQKDWVHHSPGIVSGLSFIIQSCTLPGDKIVIQPPVYHPFSRVIVENGRQVIYNPLKLEDGLYKMDIGDLRDKLDPSVKLLILCSPHNPVGRVWTIEELTQLGNVCIENNVIVVSDEIHADLLYKGYIHTPFSAISESFAQNTIICTAASKTFNLAGLQTSNIIIPNAKISHALRKTMETVHLLNPNIFGLVATESAYRYGEDWLEQLLAYLEKNLEFLDHYLKNNIAEIKVVKPQATHLVWLDCRGLGMDANRLERFMGKKAKVALNNGSMFGPGGDGFMRMNIACPRSILARALERIHHAVLNRH